MKGEINLIKNEDLNKLQDLKESLEIDAKPKKRNIKKVLSRDLIDSESFEDFNKYDYDIDDVVVMPVTPEKQKVNKKIKEKPELLTEDKIKELLEEQQEKQYERLEKMINEKLESTQYRIYCSFKAELARWYEGYYDQIK